MEVHFNFPKESFERVFYHTTEGECIYYIENGFINKLPEGFTKEKLIRSIRKATKHKKTIYIGTAVRESLGNCKHYYDARPNAVGWTNDN